MARVDVADPLAAGIPGYRRSAHRHLDGAAQHYGIRSRHAGSRIGCARCTFRSRVV